MNEELTPERKAELEAHARRAMKLTYDGMHAEMKRLDSANSDLILEAAELKAQLSAAQERIREMQAERDVYERTIKKLEQEIDTLKRAAFQRKADIHAAKLKEGE